MRSNFRIEHNIYHHTIKPNYNGNAYFGGKNISFAQMDQALRAHANMLELKGKILI